MNEIMPILVMVVSEAAALYCVYRYGKQKGFRNGVNSSVQWLAVALAKMGYQGKDLENILTSIAEHLKEIKIGTDDESDKK